MIPGYMLRIMLSLIGLAVFFIIVAQIWLDDINLSFSSSYNNFQDKIIILWWTKFTGVEKGQLRTCGKRSCFFTEDKNLLHHANTKIVVFYGSQFENSDLPLPRRPDHLWALLHEESPRNVPSFLYEPFLSLFNISSTFSRYSNFPLTTLYIESIDAITGTKYYVPTVEKNELLKDIAPVLYIQSDCVTPCDRDSYVYELMKYIKVDSYGACLNNKAMPDMFKDAMNTIRTDEFHRFVARYKFTLAIENSVCYDYITEKLWRPLTVGSVPIYLGSPTVRDWLPNNHSAILISDFASPKLLAEYLHKLNSNDDLYELHLQHKISGKVKNDDLKRSLEIRNWGITDDLSEENFVSAYECYMCNLIHNLANERSGNITSTQMIVKKTHYNCPAAYSILSNELNFTNWWNEVWRVGACYGKVIYSLVEKNVSNFTKDDMKKEVSDMIMTNKC